MRPGASPCCCTSLPTTWPSSCRTAANSSGRSRRSPRMRSSPGRPRSSRRSIRSCRRPSSGARPVRDFGAGRAAVRPDGQGLVRPRGRRSEAQGDVGALREHLSDDPDVLLPLHARGRGHLPRAALAAHAARVGRRRRRRSSTPPLRPSFARLLPLPATIWAPSGCRFAATRRPRIPPGRSPAACAAPSAAAPVKRSRTTGSMRSLRRAPGRGAGAGARTGRRPIWEAGGVE